MKNALKVTAMRTVEGKITKDWKGDFVQPIMFTVEGKEILSDVSSRKKKDLPQAVAFMQKRVDKGDVTVTLNEAGRIEMLSYMLF